jgi:hypothetical protein
MEGMEGMGEPVQLFKHVVRRCPLEKKRGTKNVVVVVVAVDPKFQRKIDFHTFC